MASNCDAEINGTNRIAYVEQIIYIDSECHFHPVPAVPQSTRHDVDLAFMYISLLFIRTPSNGEVAISCVVWLVAALLSQALCCCCFKWILQDCFFLELIDCSIYTINERHIFIIVSCEMYAVHLGDTWNYICTIKHCTYTSTFGSIEILLSLVAVLCRFPSVIVVVVVVVVVVVFVIIGNTI